MPETVTVEVKDMKRLHDALIQGDVGEAYDALYWAAQNQENAEPYAPFKHWFGEDSGGRSDHA